MQDFEGNSAYAQYTNFAVGDSVSKYTLSISGYNGTAGTLWQMVDITDTSLAQEIKTMTSGMATAPKLTKVAGGMMLAITQTSMVSTMVGHMLLMLMV